MDSNSSLPEASILAAAVETQGSTLPDIAAQLNISLDEALERMFTSGVTLPNATVDNPANTMIDQYRRLSELDNTPATPEQLLAYPDGTTLGYPKGFTSGGMVNVDAIYKAFHGERYIDPYTGAETDGKLFPVNGNTSQFIITNWESLSTETIERRFTRWLPPITEVFSYGSVDNLDVEVTITRPYDKIVGGTYEPRYVAALVERWVNGPLRRHLIRGPEYEKVFKTASPFALAWWAWIQLTHFGLLKGLAKIEVKRFFSVDSDIQTHSSVVTDAMVAQAIIHHQHKDGSPRIQTAASHHAAAPRAARNPLTLK